MFSIVRRSKRDADKARYLHSKEKVKALREKIGMLRQTNERLKRERDEAKAKVMELQGLVGASEGSAALLHQLAEAEIRQGELEKALVTAEAHALPHPLDYPLPPPRLRRRIGSNYAGVDFLAQSLAIAERLVAMVRESEYEPTAFSSVLDWGCGCGRVARHAAMLFPQAEYHGLDIDAEAIAWCTEHLARIGRFEVGSEAPPAPYPSARFDFILGISVFTHLRLDAEKAWLAELARLARPGALFCLSYLSEEATASFGFVEKQIVDRDRGFTCYATRQDNGLPYFNLTSTHTEDCLRRLWGEWFDIIAIHPASLGLQGVVLARAKA